MNKLMTVYTTAIFIILAVCVSSHAQTPEELIAIRNAADAALNAHDLDLWLSYLTDDATYDLVPYPQPMDKVGMRAFFEESFASSPDWHTTEGPVLAVDNIVVVEHMAAGTNTGGPWQGIPTTGNQWQLPHIDIYEFEGDKIKKITTYADMATLMIQLGVMPVPEMPDLVPSITLPDEEPTELSPLEANSEAFARWNSHDISLYAKMMYTDASFFIAALGMPMDRNAYTAVTELYHSAFSDVQGEVISTIDLGDGWVLSEVVFAGTHDGLYFGIPPTGYPMSVRTGVLHRFDENGLITNLNVYYDNLTVVTQITPKCPDFPPAPDYLIQDEVYSPSLEGNPMGDPSTRPVLVSLPPSYENLPEKRYPTVYLLHGYDTNHLCYTSSGVNLAIQSLIGINMDADLGSVIAELMAAGQIDELIVVMPNAVNALGGSIYEHSPLIGNYRDYIAKDLVTYIDNKYRTIAEMNARGIAGHSMGGYGALSLAMEYPEVFGAVAALSPAFCDVEVDNFIKNYLVKYPLVVGLPIPGSTPEDMWNIFMGYFEVNLLYALAAAWTPNLSNPPFYVDLPVQYPGPTIVTEIWEIWKERDLVSQIERDGAKLLGKPIFVDEGRGHTMVMAEVAGIDRLLMALHDQGLSYTYDAFDGDHTTQLRYQLASALKFLYPHIASSDTP